MPIKRLIDKGIKAVGNTSGKVVQSAKNKSGDVKDKFMAGYLENVEQECKKCGKHFTYPKESDYDHEESFWDKATTMKISVDTIRKHGLCRNCYYDYVVEKLGPRINTISKKKAEDIAREMSKPTAPLIKKYGDKWEELKRLLEEGEVNCSLNFWHIHCKVDDISDYDLEKIIMNSALCQVYSDDSGIVRSLYDSLYPLSIFLFLLLHATSVLALSEPPAKLQDPLAGTSGEGPNLLVGVLGLALIVAVILIPILVYKKYKK